MNPDLYHDDEDFVDDIGGYGGALEQHGYGGDGDFGPVAAIRAPREAKPRILLMGMRRSGKTSVLKVLFHKMSPNETLFLESTTKIIKNDIENSNFVQLELLDFPGQLDFLDASVDAEALFGDCGALVFLIDAQDDYTEPLAKLHQTISKAYSINPKIAFEVFVHKVDGISDEHKIETQRDIQQLARDDLADAGLQGVHLSFYLTSIYDHSVFEAFSKVVQKLISELPTLENLLDILISNCRIEKSFLIDIVSKIYVATDSSPVDMQTYELCCDMVDVVIDVSGIYDDEGFEEDEEKKVTRAVTKPGEEGTHSVIRLNNGLVLYLREVTKYLALVCLIRESNYEKQGLIDYNFDVFRSSLNAVLERRVPSQP